MRKMDRNEFIIKCGVGCLGLFVGGTLLQSCVGTQYVTAPITGSFLEVPANAFRMDDGSLRKFVVVQNENLQYPISVFRTEEDSYQALYMRCTHQGTELQVFGDRLQCPAHGSEFTSKGKVQNGPADQDLRAFPVTRNDELLRIDLS